MNIPVEKWYQAIQVRRSRRQFNGKKLDEKTIKYLKDFSQSLTESYQGARAVLITENPDPIFKGIIGSYGGIKGAPAYVAFIGDSLDSNMEEKVGYLGEAVILEATSWELATCWVAGFFKPEAVAQQITLAPHEVVKGVSPLGYSDKQYSWEEKVMSSLVSGRKRKNLESLCLTAFSEEWPQWIKTSLEAARLAPSAVNRQPWRFVVDENSITVSVDNIRDSYHISKRLDCGIAMLHLEVGARSMGVEGCWEYLSHPKVAKFNF